VAFTSANNSEIFRFMEQRNMKKKTYSSLSIKKRKTRWENFLQRIANFQYLWTSNQNNQSLLYRYGYTLVGEVVMHVDLPAFFLYGSAGNRIFRNCKQSVSVNWNNGCAYITSSSRQLTENWRNSNIRRPSSLARYITCGSLCVIIGKIINEAIKFCSRTVVHSNLSF